MVFALHVIVMSSAFFNPSFAFSSHFDTDGAPLSELSWPSSLAVVAVSFSGLFTFVFLMLACLCCKKGDIGFKEFENTEGEEYQADLSALASPSSQNGPEVYILPLTEVSLPVSKQPGRSIQLLKSSDLGRHSLLYLKDIGHGWFGKVLLGEVNAGLSTTQVVVKELKASASVQDQMQFLEEVQPYRTLQHPALLQCLAQCSEVTPYLLVMEFCPLGDLKSYLRSCRVADSETPDPLILQRMACDIASGLLQLHKYNFIHSDLALRNCLLTSEMSVKIGDYGLSHSRYKDDYYVTQDQIWVPLRWIAPELIDEVHGNLLVVDQTKSSNIWSLGVTVWELFELGNQPYRHYSDRQVLTYAVKEQQLKLPKPHLQFPLAERWYEVMQFCWLQPELRPSSEEVHLLVTYLCAKGSSEAEEDFEQRWNALRPNLLGSTSHTATSTALVLTPTPAPADSSGADQTQTVELASSASSSFPLLEHFSDSFHSDTGDDLLTVTETSHGLNFEYKWEQARAEQPYCSSSTSGPLGQGNPHYQDIYYSSKGSTSGGCKTDSLTSGISPSYYEPEHPGVVPVLSAHSPSVSSEYYIRIEEPVECNINLDDSVVDYSPGLEASNSRLSSESRTGSSMAQPSAYWSTADNTKSTAYDSDSSPTVQLTMEPLLRQASCTSPVKLGHSHNCFSSNQDGTIFCEQSSAYKTCRQSCLSELDTSPESLSNLVHPVGRLENTRSLSQAVSSPSLGFCDPYLEASTGHNTVNESCHNMMGPLRKTLPIVNHISIDVGTDDGLLVGRQRGEDIEDDLFPEGDATNWTSNHSANNNSLSFDSRQTGVGHDSYLDLQYTAHSNTTDLWSLTKATTRTFHSSTTGTLEAEGADTSCNAASEPTEFSSYIQLCHKERKEAAAQVERNVTAENLRNIDSHTSSSINSRGTEGGRVEGKNEKQRLYSEPKMIPETSYIKSPSSFKDPQAAQTGALSEKQRGNIWEGVSTGISVVLIDKRLNYPETSESGKALDSKVRVRESSISLAELGDYSEDDEDDITDITSGIFADFNLDYAEVEEEELSPLKNPEGTPDSVDTLNLSSSIASACDQAFSPDPFNTPILPKSLDSGYDTENNESPEFIFKELGDVRGGERSPRLGGEPELVLQVGLGQGVCTSSSSSELQLKGLTDKNPYRDSAYFSDYDAENERSPQEEGTNFFAGPTNHDFHAGKLSSVRDDNPIKRQFGNEEHLINLRHIKSCVVVNLSEADPSSPHPLPTPGLSMLSPFPPQMGGCLTKESAPADDDLGLETEHSGEEPSSELSSSIVSEPSSTVQDASANHEEGNRRAGDCSPVQSLNSDSTLTDCRDEAPEENENGDGSTEEEELPEFNHVKDETEDRREGVRINEEDFEDIDADECDSQDSLCEESNGPVDLSTSSSLLELCGEDVRAPLEEAEDEDDSDDSESDEELRTYNIQDEDSEESEEDFTVVPVVVSDCSRARHLRSLLKMPTLLTQSFCDELERKKKAVSFFDDVTVFLFDQESPTGELADYTFSTGTESIGQDSSEGNTSDHQLQPDPELEAQTCETVCVSEETDGNHSEEDGGFRWGDNPSFEPRPSSPDTIPEPRSSPTSTSNSPEAPKPAAVALNRFMVSRFSITHVSDPHMGSATGNSEDSPKD
ncbi:serine/threonine-protein kinase LMTK1 isoform X1 [Seriola aureovittata]|uniref:serine/threonine-protein kinase LMTK1 isoform X1 n=1 Tax=Seriola aureovittata TaxID=2871759 RepID=UPI0024BEA200|nr:serine/threonine-protein kinase LMTK1 isoform X1 [Seriola aureovittata]XP_056257132.1 serine/threonine-protein kinase LMTK1 isoform X1 [Seriola aureovittata]XP_056257133.1 serine/threonine-protein kinase LMTK1 isoform X1 [Seriola aureovittata]